MKLRISTNNFSVAGWSHRNLFVILVYPDTWCFFLFHGPLGSPRLELVPALAAPAPAPSMTAPSAPAARASTCASQHCGYDSCRLCTQCD